MRVNKSTMGGVFIYSASSDYIFRHNTNSCGFRIGIEGYRTKVIKSGDIVEIESFPIWDAKTGKKAKRADLSNAAQQYRNERNSIKQLTRLLNTNFTAGDIWLTLTYDHQPESEEQAYRDSTNYIRRLRRAAGGELKYIIVTETHDKDGQILRAHHHIVTDFRDRDKAEALWKLGKRKQSRVLAPDEYGLAGMAAYLAKQKKDRRSRATRRWRSSKNLKQPKITVADHKLTRRAAERLAKATEGERRDFFERLMKHKYIYTDCEIRYSDIVAGTYIYVRMRR